MSQSDYDGQLRALQKKYGIGAYAAGGSTSKGSIPRAPATQGSGSRRSQSSGASALKIHSVWSSWTKPNSSSGVVTNGHSTQSGDLLAPTATSWSALQAWDGSVSSVVVEVEVSTSIKPWALTAFVAMVDAVPANSAITPGATRDIVGYKEVPVKNSGITRIPIPFPPGVTRQLRAVGKQLSATFCAQHANELDTGDFFRTRFIVTFATTKTHEDGKTHF